MTADTLFDLGEKPAYAPPSMAQLRARDNGLTAVSTFSGGGGSSTGLHAAGWRIPWASEFIPAGRDTYLANWPETYVDDRDIREVQPADILDQIGLAPGELDLFEGSPPCSSFSTMGSRSATYGQVGVVKPYSDGVMQRVDDLFDEWLRLVEGLRPRAVLAENVPNMLSERALPYYNSIHARLRALGYVTDGGLFNAMHYGAATFRTRLIIRGVRKDSGATLPPVPRRTTWGFSLRDALDTLPGPILADELAKADAEGTVLYDAWHSLEQGQRWEPFSQVMRASWDEPLPGITTNMTANPMHPDECRLLTATEVAWIFGYPADYILTGLPRQRFERIGRSVAPPLYAAHGATLAAALGGASCAE
jgi:DNA (cytosine-5)-methyltransferase 1